MHSRLQPPQWLLSVCVFTHSGPHTRCPIGQEHVPLLHTCPIAVQGRPQAPQWALLVATLTQVPAQNVVPAGQRHAPD